MRADRQHRRQQTLSAVSLKTGDVLKKSLKGTLGFALMKGKDFKSRGRGLAVQYMSTVVIFLSNYSTALWAKKKKKNGVCAAFQQPHSFLQ